MQDRTFGLRPQQADAEAPAAEPLLEILSLEERDQGVVLPVVADIRRYVTTEPGVNVVQELFAAVAGPEIASAVEELEETMHACIDKHGSGMLRLRAGDYVRCQVSFAQGV